MGGGGGGGNLLLVTREQSPPIKAHQIKISQQLLFYFSCINLTFSFSFQLLSRIFIILQLKMIQNIDPKNFNVHEAPRDMPVN
jgi:hypothetical protein